MADLIDRDAAMRMISCYAETQQDLDDYRDMLMKIPAANRWIPCSERLPANGELVLVCFKSGNVHIAVWCGDYDEKGAWKVTSQFPTKLYRTDTITEWMPMPNTYKPTEKERYNEST